MTLVCVNLTQFVWKSQGFRVSLFSFYLIRRVRCKSSCCIKFLIFCIIKISLKIHEVIAVVKVVGLLILLSWVRFLVYLNFSTGSFSKPRLKNIKLSLKRTLKMFFKFVFNILNGILVNFTQTPFELFHSGFV
jgi:hypothetical protein